MLLSPIDVYAVAHSLVQRGWCQNHIAKTAIGASVEANDPEACQWCLTGSIIRAAHDLGVCDPAKRKVYTCHARLELGVWQAPHKGIWSSLHLFNDAAGTRVEHVLEFLDWMIKHGAPR